MIPGSPVPVQVERASRGPTPYISPVRLLARAGEMFFLAQPRPPVMKPTYAQVSDGLHGVLPMQNGREATYT